MIFICRKKRELAKIPFSLIDTREKTKIRSKHFLSRDICLQNSFKKVR